MELSRIIPNNKCLLCQNIYNGETDEISILESAQHFHSLRLLMQFALSTRQVIDMVCKRDGPLQP